MGNSNNPGKSSNPDATCVVVSSSEKVSAFLGREMQVPKFRKVARIFKTSRNSRSRFLCICSACKVHEVEKEKVGHRRSHVIGI